METSNDAYKSGEIEILTEYKRQDVAVEVKTNYGVCLMIPYSLLKNAKPRLLSAKDKHEYFCNMLLEKRGELPDFIDKYESSDVKMRINTKYGICAVTPSSLLVNNNLGIDSAENKSEYIVNRFKEIHGDKYNYDKVVYNGSINKVTITCPVHGDFDQIVGDHLNGFGCPRCSMGEFYRDVFVSKSNEDFITELMTKNDQYKNGEIEILGEYKSVTEKILVKDKYGLCNMWPTSLLNNKKSGIQSAVDKNRYYESLAREVHGDKNNYDKVNYIDSKKPVIITCKVHGDFEQNSGQHLLGKGCQRCANEKRGWNRSKWAKAAEGKLGVLYVLKCADDNETFIKVSITTQTVKVRFRDKTRMPYKYEVLYSVEDSDRNKLWNLEKQIHREIGMHKYVPKINFEGMYECFTLDSIEKIKQLIS